MNGTIFHQIHFNLIDGNLSLARKLAQQFSFTELRKGLVNDSGASADECEINTLFLLEMIDFDEHCDRINKL